MEKQINHLLECSHVSKQKGSFILSDINFTLEPGYILGVIGRNGSGKSTLLRILLGSCRLDSREAGDVRLNGVSVKEDMVEYKRQIAYVLNETPFSPWMNTRDCGRIYGNYYPDFSRARYERFLKEFEISEKACVKNLSKGQQMKQQLAFALSYGAKLYILDEPAGNLDMEFRETFYSYIRKLTEDGTRGVIYVSHLVDELEQFADYILWLSAEEKDSVKKGTQRYFGSMEELREDFQLVEADRKEASEIKSEAIAGIRKRENHQEMLVQIPREELSEQLRKVSRYGTLKEIMYYVEKGEKENETDMSGTVD